jgi:hypothetical protein
MGRKVGIALTLGLLLVGIAKDAGAQAAPPPGPTPFPNRDVTWQTVTGITTGLAAASQLVMPRFFYSDPEVTVGWKARFHVSQLAPIGLLGMLTVVNEFAFKDLAQGLRPGCDDTNVGLPGSNCGTSYGMPSTHAFASFAALGHGVGVFLIDTTKWNGGRVSVGGVLGNLVLPFTLAAITGIGRVAGDWEDFGQVAAGGGLGLGLGFLTGMTYALMARPECGYTGSLICW